MGSTWLPHDGLNEKFCKKIAEKRKICVEHDT